MLTALQELGLRGEQLAADYLQSQGWGILDRRYRNGHRDIDLVMVKTINGERTIAFVEVKTRVSNQWGGPMGAVGLKKQWEICQAAKAWVRANRKLRRPDDSFRFDVVGVIMAKQKSPVIEHIEDAFWVPVWSFRGSRG